MSIQTQSGALAKRNHSFPSRLFSTLKPALSKVSWRKGLKNYLVLWSASGHDDHDGSERDELVQSLHVPRNARQVYGNKALSSSSPPEDSDDTSSFMSSVVVVPRPTGGGYEVYRSQLATPLEDPQYEDSDLLATMKTSAVSFTASLPGGGEHTSRALRPRTGTEAETVARRGAQFSKNIFNPAMQKRAQNKLQEATKRSEMYGSTREDKQWEYDSLNNRTHARSPTFSPPVRRNSGASSVMSPAPSPSKDLTELPTGKSPLFPSSTHSQSPAVSALRTCDEPSSGNLRPRTLNFPADRTSPTPVNTGRRSFHESLAYDPRKDPFVGGNSTGHMFDSLGLDAPQSSLKQKSTVKEPEQNFSRKTGMLGIIKKLRSPKKQDHGKQSQDRLQKEAGKSHNASVNKSRSSNSFSDNIGTKSVGHSHCSQDDFDCSCKIYHRHPFSEDYVNSDVEARKERREQIIQNSLREEPEQNRDSVEDPRNIFWTPALSFHPYHHGDRKVAFSSLWPKYKELREHLQNSGIQQTVLGADAVLDLCMLACTCGPTHLLQCLVDLQLIRIDQVLESGAGLLHLAVLAHNIDTAHYLMAAKISPHIRDHKGLAADQVCFNPTVRKQMAPRYLLNKDVSRDKILLKPSLQDKDSIFKLATNPKHFVELQKKLQTLDFNVNTECDNNGDFLLHITVRKGLNQLPLLMALVKIQGADIELCNADGMTPLMLTAASGNCVLCDVLICLFGADPNKPNSQSGRSALHYAAEGNHRKTVECLIRRGADVNMEDHDGLLADDIPSCTSVVDDCREIIMFNRVRRLEMLSDLVRKGEVVSSQLLPSDLCVVDSDGHTLVMIAAIYNKFPTLHCLLEMSSSTINAQHSKTGMTALAIAASMGNMETVTVLLRHKACPTIADMNGYFPLHHAVLGNHENVVDVFIEHFPDTYSSLYKAMRLCKKTSIHQKLKAAWERRQEEIVTPKLQGCALSGNAEELFTLLDEGDNINPKSGTGNWPLYLAVENGHLEVLKLLFERGGDIRKRHPTTGATVLHVAAKMGHRNIVSYLLQYCRQPQGFREVSVERVGSDPKISTARPTVSSPSTTEKKRKLDINAIDRDHKTALQLAAERGYSRIVEMFLSHGATTAMLDSEGNLVTCPQYEGVRVMIESHRDRHTREVMRCIEDKSKRALSKLQEIWLPKFDHHLRNKEGCTPLMVAAQTGRVPVIQFLMESAVYPVQGQYDSDSDGSDSDADSGVLDPSTGSPKAHSKVEDDFQTSIDGYPDLPSPIELTSPDKIHAPSSTDSSEFYKRRLTQIVFDANRPKGLSVYHGGIISHMCAVNLHDGSTILHHAIHKSDAPHILELLLSRDPTPLNMQDDRGETVLHTACRLGRKKCVEWILAHPDRDLNIRTLEGHLPEEITSSKSIRKLIEKSRPPSIVGAGLAEAHAESSVLQTRRSPSEHSSTINFDQLQNHYQALKHGTRAEPFS